MCGILGIVHLTDRSRHWLKDALSVQGIRDRGPDNIGKFIEGAAELYHARLAVIDREAGSHQPLVSAKSAVVCNGEIYNHRELRRQMASHPFATQSDCETVGAVYEQGGVEGFDRLDGMYSFSLYDRQAQRMLLHRDPIGKKPLFVFRNDDVVVFSSTVTAILDNLRHAPTVDRKQIAFYLEQGFCDPATGFYQQIKPVLPGELYDIDIRNRRVSVRRLTHKPEDLGGFDFTNPGAIENEISDRLEQALAKRLEGVHTPVLLFSGGVDSTLLAGRMLRMRGQVKLISVKQPLGMYDEKYCRLAQKQFNAPIHYVSLWGRSFYDDIEESLRKMDQPLALPSYYFMSRLVKLARQVNNVLLTGDGADEAFFGYVPFANWHGDIESESGPVPTGPKMSWKLSGEGCYWGQTALVGHQFVKVDKATAENQVEARCPFLDWKLNEFVRRIPLSFWQREMEIKYVLKKLLLNEGFNRDYAYSRKRGFLYPFRWSLIPFYPSILRTLERNYTRLHDLGVQFQTPGYLSLHREFKKHWRLFVLARFLEQAEDRNGLDRLPAAAAVPAPAASPLPLPDAARIGLAS